MNINKQLLAGAFFIVMVELLIIMFIIDATKQKIVESLITEKFKTEKVLASQLAQSLKQDLSSVQDMLNLVALSPEIQTGNASSCQAVLVQAFPIIEKKIANVVRVDQDGLIYCAVNRVSIGINVLEDNELTTLLKSPEHEPVLHKIVLSPVSKKYVAGIHVPVFAGGKASPSGSVREHFRGSIGGVVYFDELEQKYFKDFTLLKRGWLALIDDNGDVLYHQVNKQLVGKNLLSKEVLESISDSKGYKKQIDRVLSDIKNNRPSFARYYYPPSPETIAAYYPVEIFPDRHWAVVVAVPVEDLDNQVDEDSLIAGFKNFSALSLAIIVIVMITQIILFVYLIGYISAYVKRKDDSK